MDTEALTKLIELKEQGLLTKEEFGRQKDILLNNETNNKVPVKKQKNGVKNFIVSFFVGISIVISYFCLFICIITLFDTSTIGAGARRNMGTVLGVISGIFMAIVSSSVKSGKYKNCVSGWGVFFTLWLAGGCFGTLGAGLGIFLALCQYYEIKSGKAVLEETK